VARFVLRTMADVHSGGLEPKIGTAMAYMGTALLKAIETAEMESSIEALEPLNKVRPQKPCCTDRFPALRFPLPPASFIALPHAKSRFVPLKAGLPDAVWTSVPAQPRLFPKTVATIVASRVRHSLKLEAKHYMRGCVVSFECRTATAVLALSCLR
jgi:hypothetical protein